MWPSFHIKILYDQLTLYRLTMCISCDEYPQIQRARVSISSSLVVTLLRDIPSTDRGTKDRGEGAEVKTVKEERETRGEMRPGFENPPIIKLSFIFRRGLKMKLVQDKPAEPFRRFCLFSLRVSVLRCVSLHHFLLSAISFFSDPSRSSSSVRSLFLSPPYFSFSRGSKGQWHILFDSCLRFPYSITPFSRKMTPCHSTIDLSVSSRHSFSFWNPPGHFCSPINPVEISLTPPSFIGPSVQVLAHYFIYMYKYVHIYVYIYSNIRMCIYISTILSTASFDLQM